MIGAGSWLLPACLEKLQEISGAAAFFVETQTAAEQNTVRSQRLKVRLMLKEPISNSGSGQLIIEC